MRRFALSAFLAVFPAALLLAPAVEASPAQDPSVKFHRNSAAVSGEYIVVMKEAPASNMAASQVAAINATIDSLATKHNAKVGHRYTAALVGFAGKMTEADALALAADPSVAFVEENGYVKASAVEQTGATWGLDRVDQPSLPLNQKFSQLGQGEGATIYIIDTGILATHVEFTGRMVPNAGFTAIQDGRGTTDCNGHGSHVAGTTAGTLYGIAKKAKLVPVRVLDCAGSGTNDGVIAGINYVAQNPAPRSVANMSLGGGASPAVDQAVTNGHNAGVVMVVAAGNETQDACNVSPARAPLAVTVGSTTITDARSSFSNFGTCVDISAPGSDITSAWYTSNTAINTISGTSMASPHVAGAAAAYRAANPTATQVQTIAALTSKGVTGKVTDLRGSPNLLLNARFVDITAPVTNIMSPSEGASVGSSFNVEVDANDFNLVSVELSIDGAVVDTKTAPPYTFAVSGLQKGQHTLQVLSKDLADLSTMKSVTVTVTGSGNGTGGGGGGGGGGNGTGDGNGDGGTDGGELTGGCSTTGAGAGPLLLLGLLALARRRR